MDTGTDAAALVPPPALGVERLLLVGTGSVAVADLPFWVGWLRMAYPGLCVRVVLTRSAERFVTRQSLAGRSGGEALLDHWPDEPGPRARHVELSTWPQAVIVYPATFGFVARLALGLGDSPALLAAQCTDALIGIAPAPPPGGERNPVYQAHLVSLRERPQVVVGPPVPARSQTTGELHAWSPLPLPELLASMEERRKLVARAGGPKPQSAEADGNSGPARWS
ncbi:MULTISPECIES: flavoprotein [unclassified Streptomyces]|uniref:flavoprotein n=1 Tax=unclassified Streptomyces TaxID=2593676 RepID=UPI002F917F32